MPTTRISDQQLDEAARTHVAYEARMLVDQACELHARYPDGLRRGDRFNEPVIDDALLEATLVHLRLLDDFLGLRPRRECDIHASAWITGWTAAQWLPPDVWDKVSAQVVHLAWRRVPRLDWDIRAYAYASCEELDRFFETVKLHNAPRYAAFVDAHERVRHGLSRLAPPAPAA